MAETTRNENQPSYSIYIDTGGTFSDAFVLLPDGTFYTGKVPTTPRDLSECFLSCIETAALQMGKSLDEVLQETRIIGYGTTQGTNIVVTGAGAGRLGLITTAGHEDRTLVGRQRAAGLSREQGMHIARADKPEPLIPRTMIKGVTERIDCAGKIYLPLREEEVRQAVRELIDSGAEGIAVALLWSFLNPSHERRIAEIIKEIAPGMPTSISSDTAPLVREYTRTMTTIIDLYIGRALKELLDKITSKLRSRGYINPLLVMQAAGGLSRAERAKPVSTLHSGPVGGLTGVEFLKELYGFENAAGCDPGGTSFDVCLSPKGKSEYLREPIVGRWEISNPMRDIITIGAGGGTIARVEKAVNLLIVGPESASSEPGPVCYGRGGAMPTVTDADVVLNRIDPRYFLGGRLKIDREKAYRAIKENIADPLNIDVLAAAEGIIKIIDASMASTLRSALATRGVDTSKYGLFVYGGAGATHCAGFTAGMNFQEVVVLPFAPVFCAFGAATADIRHRYEASPFVSIREIAYDQTTLRFDLEKIRELDDVRHAGIDRFNRMMEELEDKAKEDMQAEGFTPDRFHINYEILARYGGQLWELRVPIPVGRIASDRDLKGLVRAFEERYYEEYGLQAMAPRGGIQIVTIAVEAVASTPKPKLPVYQLHSENPDEAVAEQREVYFDGEFRKCKVYLWSRLKAGNLIPGPAIVEALDTTLVVPLDREVLVDKFKHLLLRSK